MGRENLDVELPFWGVEPPENFATESFGVKRENKEGVVNFSGWFSR